MSAAARRAPESQSALPAIDGHEDRMHAAQLKDACRAVAEAKGFAELAAALDHAFCPDGRPVSTGMLHNTLADVERNYLRAEWLVRLVKCGVEGRAIVEFLAGIIGERLAPERKLTPEERLEKLEEAVIEAFGPAGASVVGRFTAGKRAKR